MNETRSLILSDRIQTIDRISTTAMAAFANAESFEKEISVAQAVTDMRAALTPEVMAPIMALQNTSLGFETDRDPARTPFDKDNKPVTPYPVEVVKEVFIESRLRGFHCVGGEFSIIAGRFYARKNGLDRKVRTHPKVTDYEDTFDVPRLIGDKGAVVKCRAKWKQDGVPKEIEREFAVRVNNHMGSDGIQGKAQRKLLAAVYSRLTGQVTPDGDPGDEVVTDVKATVVPQTGADMFKGKQPAQPEPQAPTQTAQPPVETAPAAAPAEPPQQPAEVAAAPTPVEHTPESLLAEFVAMSGFTFDDFHRWVKTSGQVDAATLEELTSFDKVHPDSAKRMLRSKAGLLRGLGLARAERDKKQG